METDKIIKLESEARIMELKPFETLTAAGFKDGMTLCDIGAGTGLFAFSAATISRGNIYALEVSEQMLDLLAQRAKERKTGNLLIKKVDSEVLPLADESCDMAIMVTVLHEVENKERMIREIRRIVKHSGKLMIIEFHDHKTPMGPPVELRLAAEYVEGLCMSEGMRIVSRDSMGDNLYLLVFDIS